MNTQTISRQTGRTPEAEGAAAKPVSLRQAAYEGIEELLNSGRLRPGQLISQRELMDMTGATLGAVREAIPRFEAEGLLVTVPKRGLMVPGLDIHFVRDAYQMRRLLEVAALPEIAAKLDPALLRNWIARHQEGQAQLLQADPAGHDAAAHMIQHLDWEMHEGLIAALGNAVMSNVYRVNAIKVRMAVQSQIKVTPANAVRVIREHLAFLEPMAEGRHAEAQQALNLHITNSMRIALGEPITGGP